MDAWPPRAAFSSQRYEDWSGRRDSNPRPIAWEAIALPLRHSRVQMQYTQVRYLRQGSPLAIGAGGDFRLRMAVRGVTCAIKTSRYKKTSTGHSYQSDASIHSRGGKTQRMPTPIRGAERAQELGISVRWRVRRITRLAAAAGLALVVLFVAGCSAGGSSSGGTNISLGLAGSTADHPSAPPSVAAAGPNDTYAFVYGDQIWIHKSGSSNQSSSCNCQSSCNPCQLTNIELSNGADISWGPLVWSPDGSHIAFALIQNLTPTTPDRTAGPIYVVNTTTVGTTVTGTTVVTPGIGSIYGHNYVWYGPNMLFYSSGDGISMYDIGDPDPRVWQVLSAMTSTGDSTGWPDFHQQ